MVPAEYTVATVVLIILSVLLPIAVWFFVWRRTKAGIVNLLVGMAVFFVCFIIAIITQSIASLLITSPIVLALVLSLRAGLVEEFARFIAFKFFLKNRKKTSDAVMYGVGHGGMEVLLVFTTAMVSQLMIFMMANSGSLDSFLAASPAQAQALNESLATLTQTSPWITSVGLLERVIAMTYHIAASVIVFCAVRQKKWAYLVLAITLHTLFNFSTVLYTMGLINAWQIEALLAVEVIGIALIALRIAKRFIAKNKERSEEV